MKNNNNIKKLRHYSAYVLLGFAHVLGIVLYIWVVFLDRWLFTVNNVMAQLMITITINLHEQQISWLVHTSNQSEPTHLLTKGSTSMYSFHHFFCAVEEKSSWKTHESASTGFLVLAVFCDFQDLNGNMISPVHKETSYNQHYEDCRENCGRDDPRLRRSFFWTAWVIVTTDRLIRRGLCSTTRPVNFSHLPVKETRAWHRSSE